MTEKLLISKLTKFLEDALPANDPRRKVAIQSAGDWTIVGEVVSSAFDRLNSEQQQKLFEKYLVAFCKEQKLTHGISPAVLLYSPEEHRLAAHKELEGVLRTVNIHTLAGNDILVTIDARWWSKFLTKLDESDSDDPVEIMGLVREKSNLHLYHALQGAFGTVSYKWFDCKGRYFRLTSKPTIERQDRGIGALISFKATHVPSWEI